MLNKRGKKMVIMNLELEKAHDKAEHDISMVVFFSFKKQTNNFNVRCRPWVVPPPPPPPKIPKTHDLHLTIDLISRNTVER